MSESGRSWSTPRTQIATIFLIVVGLYLVGTIASRAINILDLKRQQATMIGAHADLVQTVEDLRVQAEYFQSDSYLEQAARSMLWGRPGERLIVPLSDAGPSKPSATPARKP